MTDIYLTALVVSGGSIYAVDEGGVQVRPLAQMGVSATAVKEIRNEIPAKFSLSQNYPNPFNPTTTINYQLPVSGQVTLKVYDVLGREVESLVDKEQTTGTYSVTFNGNSLPSGVYLYRIQAGSFSQTKKLMLLK